MNNAKSMSLRARINNFSKQHGISPQLTLQSFFAERFLARIAKSPYVNNLAIKGGTLMRYYTTGNLRLTHSRHLISNVINGDVTP